MWLSKKAANGQTDSAINRGEVTIGGLRPAVYTGAEQRGIGVCAPGGYAWKPKAGDDVIVIKCDDGEAQIAGMCMDGEGDNLNGGEVCIKSDGGASAFLKNDGSIILKGDIFIDGRLFINGNEVI